MTKRKNNYICAFFVNGTKHSNIGILIEFLSFSTYRTKKQESNIMRIGMNEEMKLDIS
jgi:hypothetical protein